MSDAEILKLDTVTLSRNHSREWFHALMDYGAEKLKDIPNPNRRSARYAKQTQFKGSTRELRGKIIAFLTKHRKISVLDLARRLHTHERKLLSIIHRLTDEGFLESQENVIRL